MRPWFIIPFFYCVFCGVVNAGMWYVNGLALITAAKALVERFDQVSEH
jgi:hypothetical protein